MDKMQEEFERWARKEGFKMERVAEDPYFYDWASTSSAWKAWRASRKALVVELPVSFPVCDDKDSAEVSFIMDIHMALDAAGVAYK